MTMTPGTPVTQPSADAAGRDLTITMTPPGHWHFTFTKELTFTVRDAAGRPVEGLTPEVTVRTQSGHLDRLIPEDEGDGTYTAPYTAWEIGSDYATAYAVAFTVSYGGRQYTEAWPVEIVRDGREDIFKGDGRYLYQVRYGWSPGRPTAGAATPVVFYFEPRRAIAEGEQISDRRQPWRYPGNHLPGLTATVLIRSKDGSVREEIPARYTGLGVYRAERVFAPAEVAEGRAYLVSLLFTDPYNGETIGVENNTYPLDVRGAGT